MPHIWMNHVFIQPSALIWSHEYRSPRSKNISITPSSKSATISMSDSRAWKKKTSIIQTHTINADTALWMDTLTKKKVIFKEKEKYYSENLYYLDPWKIWRQKRFMNRHSYKRVHSNKSPTHIQKSPTTNSEESLYTLKQALSALSTEPLWTPKRALHTCKRALHTFKRALLQTQKSPCTRWNEPYGHSKEPDTHSKEPPIEKFGQKSPVHT